jgi:NADH pyrophosphatase NudC (nudix superfamily)
MAKLAVYPSVVNSAPLSQRTRRQFNARATCPWCGSPMYLNRAGTRLQCADVSRCAGVIRVTPVDETQP